MKHGEPDIIQIRKTFNDKDKAIRFEQSLIKRAKLHLNENFLNMGCHAAFNIPTDVLSKRMTARNKSPSARLKSRETMLRNNPMFDPEIRAKVKQTKSERDYKETYKNRIYAMHNPETAKRHALSIKGRHWYNDGVRNYLVHVPIAGWERGRVKVTSTSIS